MVSYKWICAGVLSIVSCAANAVTPGWYIGGAAGQSFYDFDKGEFDSIARFAFETNDAIITSFQSDLDDKDTAWSLLGGFEFSQYLSAEVGYVDLGKSGYRSDLSLIVLDTFEQAQALLDVDTQVRGFTAAAVGTLYFTQQVSVRGKIGVFFAETSNRVTLTVNAIEPFVQSDEFKDDSQNVFLGLGAGLDVNDRLTLTLDLTRYQIGDAERRDDEHVDSAQLGFIYRLR